MGRVNTCLSQMAQHVGQPGLLQSSCCRLLYRPGACYYQVRPYRQRARHCQLTLTKDRVPCDVVVDGVMVLRHRQHYLVARSARAMAPTLLCGVAYCQWQRGIIPSAFGTMLSHSLSYENHIRIECDAMAHALRVTAAVLAFNSAWLPSHIKLPAPPHHSSWVLRLESALES